MAPSLWRIFTTSTTQTTGNANMLLTNAINKLEKAGYEVSGNLGSYVATAGSVTISFFATDGVTGRFTYESLSSGAPTFGLNLKQALG